MCMDSSEEWPLLVSIGKGGGIEGRFIEPELDLRCRDADPVAEEGGLS